MEKLFESFTFGNFSVKNRIAMAPLTRMRAPGEVPNDLMVEYYKQRAGAGLIISEGVLISTVARGHARTPGIYTKEQIEGWKKVTDAVHKQGGKIFAQIWHVGRRSHESIAHEQPVGPSAIPDPTYVHAVDANGQISRVPAPVPREMTKEYLKKTLNDFVQAAKNSIEAGFDGVELHSAHGYLLDQFLRKASNIREDEYGGSIDNRIRFVYEVTEAVVKAIGGGRTAIRFSPFGMMVEDDEIVELTLKLIKKLEPLKLAYLHFSENIAKMVEVPESFRKQVRADYHNPIMVCGELTGEKAAKLVSDGYADMVAFGRLYIVNPDLAERLQKGLPLTPVTEEDKSKFFTEGAEGYTDYKTAQ